MAMTKCSECKNPMSTKAAACPSCGATAPKKTSMVIWVIAGFLGLGIAGSIAGNMAATKKADEAAAAQAAKFAADPAAKAEYERQQLAKQQQAAEDKKRFALAVAAVKSIKASLRDPASLEVESVGVSADMKTVCATYRARNGFGGLNVETLAFVGEKTTREPKVVASKCQGLLDFTHARQAL